MVISPYQIPLQYSHLPRKTVERFDQHFMAYICIYTLLVHVVRMLCDIKLLAVSLGRLEYCKGNW